MSSSELSIAGHFSERVDRFRLALEVEPKGGKRNCSQSMRYSHATIVSARARPTREGKEIDIKFMPNGTNVMFTAALFDITQQDILSPDPLTGRLTSLQTDEARVRGFEFEVRGNVTRELEIVGGYSNLDSEITKSAYAPDALSISEYSRKRSRRCF